MRLGSADGPLGSLNATIHAIQDTFLNVVQQYTATTPRKVMLGDATITEETTFDAEAVGRMFRNITANLPGWEARDVTITNNEDIRRVFVKFDTCVGNYTVQGHFSLQFHVLLYYMPDQRVIDCQKRLSAIMDEAKSGEEKLADMSDSIIYEGVRAPGETDVSHIDVFERLYNDDSLVEKLESQLDGAAGEKLQQLAAEKKRLFNELDGLLTETYRTVPVMIDDARLVTGEEGCLCTFDIEKPGGFIPGDMDSATPSIINDRLHTVQRALSSVVKPAPS